MEPELAIERAKELVRNMFGADAASPPRLEEIELENNSIWSVTLSFRRAQPLASGALAITMAPSLVNYRKNVKLNSEDGKLVSIKDLNSVQ